MNGLVCIRWSDRNGGKIGTLTKAQLPQCRFEIGDPEDSVWDGGTSSNLLVVDIINIGLEFSK